MRKSKLALGGKALVWQLPVWVLSLLILFLSSGTFAWPAGWIFFGVFFGFVLFLSVWLFFRAPDLLEERLTLLKADQLPEDQVWLIAFYILSLAWLALMPMDAVRLHWSRMPSCVQSVGLLLLFGALVGIFVTIRVNPYLSPVVRLQVERSQSVISSGPYRYVRHPLYCSAFLFYLGVPLLLGSWAGFALAPLFVGLLVLRAVLEERMLRDGLSDYHAYMIKVKRRFIPGIW